MAQSYTGLEREFRKNTGQGFDEKQSKRAMDIADRSKQTGDAYKKANKDMMDTVDREFKKVKAPKIETLKQLGELFGKALEEVCDI
jgi:hypothetical protein